MKLPELNIKNIAVGGGIAGAGFYGINNMPTQVSNAIGSVSSVVGQAVGYTSQAASNILGTHVPTMGAFAPYAAPMIAGGWLGNKLSHAMDVEDKTLKNLVTITGTGAGALAGAALVGSAATPFLTIAGTGLGIWYGGKYGLKSLGWTFKKVGGAFKGMKSA